jgi:signal transduction histidine kinase
VDEFRPVAAAKGIQLAADIDTAAGPILGDPTRLKQILANLLSNAIKFTNEGGRIDISLKAHR